MRKYTIVVDVVIVLVVGIVLLSYNTLVLLFFFLSRMFYVRNPALPCQYYKCIYITVCTLLVCPSNGTWTVDFDRVTLCRSRALQKSNAF